MEGVNNYDIFRTRNTVIEMLKDRGFLIDTIPNLTIQTIDTIINDKDEKDFESIFYIDTQKTDDDTWVDMEPVQSYSNIRKIDFRDTRIIGETLVETKEEADVSLEPRRGKFYEYSFIEDASKLTPGDMVVVTDFQDKFFQQIGVIQDVLSDGTIMVWVKDHDDAFPYRKDQLNLAIEREDVQQPTIAFAGEQQDSYGYMATTPPSGEYTYNPTTPPAEGYTYNPTTPPPAEGYSYNPTTPPPAEGYAYNPTTPPPAEGYTYNPTSPGDDYTYTEQSGSPAYTPGVALSGAVVDYPSDSDEGTPKSVVVDSFGGKRVIEQQGGKRQSHNENGRRKDDSDINVKVKKIQVDKYNKMKGVVKQSGGGRRKMLTKKDLGIPESVEVHFIYPNNSKNRIKKVLSKFEKQQDAQDMTDLIFVVFDKYIKDDGYDGFKKLIEPYRQFEKPGIQVFHYKQLLINIMKHEYVPKHTLLKPTEIDTLLEKHYLTNVKELPKIMTTDPVVKYYGAKENNVFRIDRSSKTFGHSIYYRCVCLGDAENDS